MNPIQEDYFELRDGAVQLSLQNGTSIHIRCISKYGDPVELCSEEARDLSELLTKLAERAD